MLGEAFSLAGIAIPIIVFPRIEGLMGLVFIGVGAFFINRKINTMKTGLAVLRHGLKTTAEITNIENTNIEHNDRRVKEYNFQYEANGKLFNYQYQSAYKRHLEVGDKMTLFYLENNPKISFIPQLYNLRID